MPETSTPTGLAQRLQSIRKRRGLTQKELADLSGVSKSLISKIEQELVTEPQMATAHKLAIALRMNTSELLKGSLRAEEEPPIDTGLWEPVERALHGRTPALQEDPSLSEVRGQIDGLKPLLAANRYGEVATLLPHLIRDVETLNGEGRAVRSRLLNVTGWLFVQLRQFERAEAPIRLAIDAAEDRLDAAAAVATLVWMHLRMGQLTEARELATRWADDIEPRFSRASTAELAMWGRLLISVSSAAVRDNRPGEAEDAIRLARAAAVRIGRETETDTSTARTFGPVTVAMVTAENASTLAKHDKVLAIADRIPGNLLNGDSASRNRHRLDVAEALRATGKPSDAMAILEDLYHSAPEWLVAQKYAQKILAELLKRRRTLTLSTRNLADALHVPY
ncbi:helix-turn-helix domain-containing protein [Streptosporangium sp. NBC_01495]|uniref:helix-turn-helix domain-containing protein n=1 Tax=Streptosporangium sp. NBC_01495 TaxID=2903899 RepID=UPI002E305B3D|nr:helix-turn-helix transcriptional regulator [Streptosporangium sp. NBC_01495]